MIKVGSKISALGDWWNEVSRDGDGRRKGPLELALEGGIYLALTAWTNMEEALDGIGYLHARNVLARADNGRSYEPLVLDWSRQVVRDWQSRYKHFGWL